MEKYKNAGEHTCTQQETKLISDTLEDMEYDDYDRLVQICDAIGGAEGVLDMEVRMLDVKSRYGNYPQKKWDDNLWLRKYFEKKMGEDLYVAVDKENFRP